MKNDCVFCDRRKLEERIIFENANWRVVATLGQITDGGYVLVIPKEHISCLGALTWRQMISMFKTTGEIYNALQKEYQKNGSPCPITAFEHGIVGQTIKHAHLHLLPKEIDLTEKICSDFPMAKLERLEGFGQLRELYKKYQKPYLYWTLPNGKGMVCWNPTAPSQYLRLIAAELLGRPERGNWRNMDADLDKRLGEETVLRLKSYF